MTLKKYLESLPYGTTVAIGAKDGSGWFYIGEAHMYDTIIQVCDKRLSLEKEKARRLRERIRSIMTHIPKELTDKECDRYAIKIANLYMDIEESNRYIASYNDVTTRKVLDHYKKETDVDYGILVEGKETKGMVWDSSEFAEKFHAVLEAK